MHFNEKPCSYIMLLTHTRDGARAGHLGQHAVVSGHANTSQSAPFCDSLHCSGGGGCTVQLVPGEQTPSSFQA